MHVRSVVSHWRSGNKTRRRCQPTGGGKKQCTAAAVEVKAWFWQTRAVGLVRVHLVTPGA